MYLSIYLTQSSTMIINNKLSYLLKSSRNLSIILRNHIPITIFSFFLYYSLINCNSLKLMKISSNSSIKSLKMMINDESKEKMLNIVFTNSLNECHMDLFDKNYFKQIKRFIGKNISLYVDVSSCIFIFDLIMSS